MRPILNYIRYYFQQQNKFILGLVSLLTALLIFWNYHFRIDDRIDSEFSRVTIFVFRYSIFFFAFAIPWLLYILHGKKNYLQYRKFYLVLFVAPALFALKMALHLPVEISNDPAWNYYWNIILYWPLRLLIMFVLLFIIWKMFDNDQPFYGTDARMLKWKPYVIMLAIMIPLIALASTQPDFLATYPKLKMIGYLEYEDAFRGWHELLFELSYGSDFIGIELFFRGFLIMACIKWAGKDAILPMAVFYCTIHFGKPLGECISSYFGGIILGIVSAHTRTIWGGLAVHLGIAWLMELGGYIGNSI